jgi:hypothetical protein
MLVTFREHAAPDLCIFHKPVTIAEKRARTSGLAPAVAISALFTAQYEYRTTLWYLKC